MPAGALTKSGSLHNATARGFGVQVRNELHLGFAGVLL